MKLMLRACLVIGALAVATHVVAAPFLSVDINGSNGGPGSQGPTQAGYEGWTAIEGLFVDPTEDWANSGAAGLTKVFATSEGNISANLVGVGSFRGSRNRGANTGGLTDLQQDFPFAQRDNAIAFGRNYIKLTLSGLIPNQDYRFRGFAREAAFQAANLADPNDPGQSYQAWTDLAELGGVDGPAAWLDANVSAGASYQPIFTDADMDPNTPPVDTGYKNPIPTLARSQVAGPDSLSQVNTLFHSASFPTTADGSGMVTVYTWSDPNGFGQTVQGASLLNGFEIGIIPEPTSLALVFVGLAGLAGFRRR